MKTERLIDWLNSVPTWYITDGKILDEVIERLKELEELKKALKIAREFQEKIER